MNFPRGKGKKGKGRGRKGAGRGAGQPPRNGVQCLRSEGLRRQAMNETEQKIEEIEKRKKLKISKMSYHTATAPTLAPKL